MRHDALDAADQKHMIELESLRAMERAERDAIAVVLAFFVRTEAEALKEAAELGEAHRPVVLFAFFEKVEDVDAISAAVQRVAVLTGNRFGRKADRAEEPPRNDRDALLLCEARARLADGAIENLSAPFPRFGEIVDLVNAAQALKECESRLRAMSFKLGEAHIAESARRIVDDAP